MKTEIIKIEFIAFKPNSPNKIREFIEKGLIEEGIKFFPIETETKYFDFEDTHSLNIHPRTNEHALEYFNDLNNRRTHIEKEIELTESLLSDLKKELKSL